MLLVAGLINFGVKNQVPQFPFEVVAGDLMSVLFYVFDDIIFCVYMYILEIISYFRNDPFILINLELSKNSFMIACTNTQNFEEKENCASTISMERTLGYDMNLFGSDIILFGSDLISLGPSFQFHELPMLLLDGLIYFGVKNQVPKFSFEVVAGDLMSVLFYEFDDIIFYGSLDIWK